MTDRMQLLVYLGSGTFVIVVFIAVLMVLRGARSPETAVTLAAIRKVDESVEGMRLQNSYEHKDLQARARWSGNELKRIVERLGFLKAKQPEVEMPHPDDDKAA